MNLNFTEFYSKDIETTLENLKTSLNGLSYQEAEERLKVYGKNVIEEGKKKSIFALFMEQFKNVMVLVLFAAAIISILLGEAADAAIILAVLLINAVFGVVQELKAEKAIDALKKLNMPYAKVYRDGHLMQIKTDEIVVGDIIEIEAGDIVPADLRLIESFNLKIDESALTGESVPVEKNANDLLAESTPLAERTNMAFMGTIVTYGRAKGVVVSTGMKTEIGKIANFVNLQSAIDTKTPLHEKLEEIGKYLTVGILAIAFIVFVTGLLYKRDVFEMFLTAVSLAVAAIPEGLPAVVTIVLAIGVQRMAKRNAIIRRLSSIETLGRVEVICSDKTGTLTQNKMNVVKVYCNDNLSENLEHEDIVAKTLLRIMALCNDVKLDLVDKQPQFIGDPTEIALVKFAYEKGLNKNAIEKVFKRVYEIPFDSVRKMMTTVHEVKNDEKLLVFSKGAVDVIINKCKFIMVNDEILPLDQNMYQKIIQANKEMTSNALRVLAFAYKEIDKNELENKNTIEENLIFIGLVGMIDPPRKEAYEAVEICYQAGIIPVMITGDHKDTALAIAKELKIIDTSKDELSQVLIGTEIEKLDDQQLKEKVKEVRVYARVSPEHKLRIVDAWKSHGKIVAMTGDGVNDAPALKAADIGIGMGITGTDVTKNVSDVILADDNFATIVAAVEEGRKIYDNIRKTIQFLLSSNIGEVVTLFLATLLNWVVLYPIHILWVNLVTDTFPALALGMEKAESDVMKRKPKKTSENIFAGGLGFSILYQGFLKGLITLLVFFIGNKLYDHKTAITMTFMTLSLIQLTHAYNVRSNINSLFKMGVFSNKYLNLAFVASFLLQVVVLIVPPLRELFKLSYLNFSQWTIIILASISIIPIVEVVKYFTRHFHKE
ncbi:Ca2+-transporting ATPase [Caldicellulosiruptor bescii]|uniref:P-type Ca(2+) transporter n=2 Tax=Caldicellulosiruptor bescii TaxID=31899 RepID=B9MNA2_CALBD|nr:calcium-translocating P-type ATPase, SERCA-type [Caldicellulosiruptor bescii]ACM61433.1 calcium-translocating P-type ATPase, PMCA-type [Caldicellulosiruptor bescii DSM 6725]PBC88754.1 Ca2+-transporting ATPase [Caldicellulosiruptor bescii]PBD02824.1 Ca2+-transporting ATPase [Caldicellulosiruptor bescii]PBD07560.1 Ca2+-transporting ATPase [Caldicellulosiruptor bescii]PBD10125.1 Ca2+-transporting ATPase [Caldicellulosiruptor bescii]